MVAPHDKSTKIANVDLRAGQGDVIKVGSLLARVLETPGHTLDHIAYVFDTEKALFAADTLFSIGCGRVFEGTYPMMWDSLLKLRALPDDFKLYCGHEYTAANVKFALTVDADNPALKARAEEVTRLRAENKPTIPMLLGEEKKANVFLRADEPSVAAQLRHEGRRAPPTCSANCANARTSPDGGLPNAAAEIIARLDLKPHPEGGHFRETFRDARVDAERTLALDRDLFPAGARRALALASHRCRGDLALLRGRRADAARSPMMTASAASGSAPISRPAKCRRRSCRRMPGRPPKAPATGRWSDARWRPGFEFAKFELAPKGLDEPVRLHVPMNGGHASLCPPYFFPTPYPSPRSSRRRRSAPRRSRCVAVGCAKPARIRNAVDSSGVA